MRDALLWVILLLMFIGVAWLEYTRFVECTEKYPFWQCGIVK